MTSRTMAVLLVAFPMGLSMAEMNQSDLMRYRSLGHRELLAVVEDNASMGLAGCVATSIGMVGITFLAVFGLSLGIDRVLGALTRGAPRSGL